MLRLRLRLAPLSRVASLSSEAAPPSRFLRPASPPRWKALEYKTLEVMDTTEIDSLQEELRLERERLTEDYRVAKLEKRKVIWKNAQFDLARMDRLEQWIESVRKDSRRTW